MRCLYVCYRVLRLRCCQFLTGLERRVPKGRGRWPLLRWKQLGCSRLLTCEGLQARRFFAWAIASFFLVILLTGYPQGGGWHGGGWMVHAQPRELVLASDRVIDLETAWGEQYTEYFQEGDRPPITVDFITQRLRQLSDSSGEQTALIYTASQPDGLELILLLPSGSVIRRVVRDAAPFQLRRAIADLHRELTTPFPNQTQRRFSASQRLYRWIIAPLEPLLESANIDVLLFCAGPQLRTLPYGALSDGQHFLAETYGIGLIPAFNLFKAQYRPLRDTSILAMGASEFQTLADLPGVPSELEAIAQLPWPSTTALNADFTLDHLQQQLQTNPFAVVHLATHAQFLPGTADQSLIHLWNTETLPLTELNQLPWENAAVDLLVLSACQTAVGDRQSELGFAGVAHKAGVNTTLASLWRVSDLGTFVLMKEFYAQLTHPDIHTKVEALRRAQQTLISGTVYLENGIIHSPTGNFPLPPALAANVPTESLFATPQLETAVDSKLNFAAPYYWSSFTLIGSPW